MNKVYISGQITGMPDLNRGAFAHAEEKIHKSGNVAINPHVICGHLPKDSTWEQYMDVCLEALQYCQEIYMLEGWHLSRGARIEQERAVELGLKVVYE
jgi:hypothetical protein